MKPYRILITGSRRMRDPGPIIEAFLRIDLEMEGPASLIVVHGAGPGDSETGAPGCDTLAESLFSKDWPFPREYDFSKLVEDVDRHPPVPSKFGRWPAAGPRRNSHMVSLGADVCLAFPCRQSKGTVDCMTKAWKAGIPTRIWRIEP